MFILHRHSVNCLRKLEWIDQTLYVCKSELNEARITRFNAQ